MNRGVLTLSVLLFAVLLVFRFCSNKPEKVVEEKPVPLTISANSGTFNESFSRLLRSYFLLKDAFVASDPQKAGAAALEIVQTADSLNVNEIKGDTSGTIRETAKYFASTISGSAKTIAAEKDLENQRKEFENLTDALWSLTRTVQYNGEKVYYQYCPMAFDNKGAYWLSDHRDIRNPYFGDKMPDCGEVADSLDYSKR